MNITDGGKTLRWDVNKKTMFRFTILHKDYKTKRVVSMRFSHIVAHS